MDARVRAEMSKVDPVRAQACRAGVGGLISLMLVPFIPA